MFGLKLAPQSSSQLTQPVIQSPGKSSLLSALGRREVPIPEHIDIFHLTREMPASDKTALQCVMEVDQERVKLEKLAEELAHSDDDGESL